MRWLCSIVLATGCSFTAPPIQNGTIYFTSTRGGSLDIYMATR